jgi:hypothetical protein
MHAALNGLDMMACDLENAYLNSPCMEKIWFEGGLECGSVCVVVHALYGLKSAGASWHVMLAQAIHDIGFVSTIADPDLWIQPVAHKDGYKYHEMLLVYVDDVLAISHESKVLIDAIGEYYKVKNAIKTVEGLLAEDGEGYVLKNKAKNPFPMNYQPKLDVLN